LEQSAVNEQTKQMKDYFFNNETLQSEDIAEAILDVLSKPKRVAINEVIIRPNL
jgi:NADP-dependent 3-hydroxy acid dehydrogenase YdfG